MYYCLISSLAELSLATDARRIDFSNLRAEISNDLSSKDRKAMELLYTYYDVENLLAALRASDLPHNELGNLSKDQIQAEIKSDETPDEPFVSLLPHAVRSSLDLYLGRVELGEDDEPLHDIERALLMAFYRQCDAQSCRFLKEWAEADRCIRNTVAGEQYAIGEPCSDEKEQSWWSDLQTVMDTEDFVEREHKMDALRWNLADELSQGHYFDIDATLNYVIKLNILQRWAYLNKDFGRERFEAIVKNFTDNISI